MSSIDYVIGYNFVIDPQKVTTEEARGFLKAYGYPVPEDEAGLKELKECLEGGDEMSYGELEENLPVLEDGSYVLFADCAYPGLVLEVVAGGKVETHIAYATDIARGLGVAIATDGFSKKPFGPPAPKRPRPAFAGPGRGRLAAPREAPRKGAERAPCDREETTTGYREVLVPVKDKKEAAEVRKRAKATNPDLLVFCDTELKRDRGSLKKGDLFVVMGGWNEAFVRNGDEGRYVPFGSIAIENVLAGTWFQMPDLEYADLFCDSDPEEGVEALGRD